MGLHGLLRDVVPGTPEGIAVGTHALEELDERYCHVWTRYCQLSGMRPKWSHFAESWRHSLCACDLLPNLKRLSPQQTIIDRLQEVAAQAKEILREPMKREKRYCQVK